MRFVYIGYILAAIVLFFYSYTQVDLNLTLPGGGVFQSIQKKVQYIGYFNRPLSVLMYILQLVVWYFLYGYLLVISFTKTIDKKCIWKIIYLISMLLILSYPAFSYDIFNYIFTAKTVLVYHKNPYVVIPQQFMSIEPIVRIMRWIHLPSAYTPLWIILTLPAYIFSFNIFLLVLWNFKLIAVISYIISTYFLEKILTIIEPKRAVFGLVLFALNPLIIFETLVSGHNDIVMIMFALSAIYYALINKRLLSFFLFSLSVALKLMTVFIAPLYLFSGRFVVDDKELFSKRISRLFALGLMVAGLLLVLTKREVLPWYFVWIIPFVSLLPHSIELSLLAFFASFGLLLRYAPFLYYGYWDPPVTVIKQYLTAVPILIGCMLVVFRYLRKRSVR